jgi:hypothetical protein
MKVITHIMQIVSPSSVIDVMKVSYDDKSPSIKREIGREGRDRESIEEN